MQISNRCDFSFQEITLQKSNSQEQLGLTVSYIHCAAGSGGSIGGGGNNSAGNNSVKSINEVDSEASTEVYISNIIPDSLAARDGRLRQGDQILQVSLVSLRAINTNYRGGCIKFHSIERGNLLKVLGRHLKTNYLISSINKESLQETVI